MKRHALTDEQWSIIEPMMPPEKSTGRPRRDLRTIVEGILWIVRTGAPWRDLPKRFGPWQTVYDWFNGWSKDGAWDRILEALQIRLDAEGRIDWDMWCVDGSNVRASRSRGGFGTKLHLVTDGHGLPLAIEVTAGQRHESTQFEALMEAVRIPQPLGPPRRRRRRRQGIQLSAHPALASPARDPGRYPDAIGPAGASSWASSRVRPRGIPRPKRH